MILWTIIRRKCTERGKEDSKDGSSAAKKSKEELADEELLKSVRGLIVYSDVDLDPQEANNIGIDEWGALDDDFGLENGKKRLEINESAKNMADEKNNPFDFLDAAEEGIDDRERSQGL